MNKISNYKRFFQAKVSLTEPQCQKLSNIFIKRKPDSITMILQSPFLIYVGDISDTLHQKHILGEILYKYYYEDIEMPTIYVSILQASPTLLRVHMTQTSCSTYQIGLATLEKLKQIKATARYSRYLNVYS